MDNNAEWGPWIEHDGQHLPPDGAVVQALFDDEMILTGVMSHSDDTHIDAFLWLGDEATSHVIRYRIRKPRGLTIIEGLLEHLLDEVDA